MFLWDFDFALIQSFYVSFPFLAPIAFIAFIKQKKEKLKNAENVSMYHEYIETVFKPNASTIKEAIARNDYIENECWVNALVEPRKKNQLTREKILDVLKMNEEEFNKNGASIEDVFNHFTIPVRIFDIIGNCIYKTEHVNKKSEPFMASLRITIFTL